MTLSRHLAGDLFVKFDNSYFQNQAHFRLILHEMICLKCFSLNIYPKKEANDSHKLYSNSNKTRSQANCGDEKCILQICKKSVMD